MTSGGGETRMACWAEVPEDRGLSIGWMFFVSPKHNKKGLCSGVCWCYIFFGTFSESLYLEGLPRFQGEVFEFSSTT